MAAKSARTQSPLITYLQLLRIPNVFTALSDVAMGYIVVQQSLYPVFPFVGLAIATVLMYSAGMVLNDVYDIEVDREERPDRPLPSGRVDLAFARKLGFGMLAGGVVAAFLAGFLPGSQAPIPYRSGVMAVVLAICILGYNAVLKKTLAGPVVMGGCRFFNILMGMGLAQRVATEHNPTFGYAPFQLVVAGSIGIYIVGITIYSRQEVEKGARGPLALGFVLVLTGLAGLAFFGLLADPDQDWMRASSEVRILLIAAVGFSIARRCFVGLQDPSPGNIQAAIKHALLSLIVLDAAVSVQVADAGWGAGILALLIPAVYLGRKVYST